MTDKIKINATLEWANLSIPNEMSGKFQVDLCNLSDAAVAALSEMGVEARYREDKPEKGHYITCKSVRPIKAYDSDGDVIEDLVGNGSKATAIVGTYEWEFKKKKGISPSLQKLVITDLVDYESPEDDLEAA